MSPQSDRRERLEVLVLGDSVPWGQGHHAERKFATRATEILAETLGHPSWHLTNYSHSGAAIGTPTDPPAPGQLDMEGIEGELPHGTPTIHAQVQAAVRDIDAGTVPEPDLVVLDGGVNDQHQDKSLLSGWIINPSSDVEQLRTLTREICYARMKSLVEIVLDQLPGAAVVITGYYPIFSRQSRTVLAAAYCTTNCDPEDMDPADLAASPIGKLAERSRVWSEESTASLQRVVDEVNDPVQPRVALAHVDFQDENCLFAPRTWLWGLTDASFHFPRLPLLQWRDVWKWLRALGGELLEIIHGLEPQDPRKNQRRRACNEKSNCPWASVGHPNVLGSGRFRDAVVGAAEPLLRRLPPV